MAAVLLCKGCRFQFHSEGLPAIHCNSFSEMVAIYFNKVLANEPGWISNVLLWRNCHTRTPKTVCFSFINGQSLPSRPHILSYFQPRCRSVRGGSLRRNYCRCHFPCGIVVAIFASLFVHTKVTLSMNTTLWIPRPSIVRV